MGPLDEYRRRLTPAVGAAIAAGADGAAIFDRRGRALAVAGLSDDDVAALGGVAARGVRGAGLVGALLAGEPHRFALDERAAAIAIAGRVVFLVVVCRPGLEPVIDAALAVMAGAGARELGAIVRPRHASGDDGGGDSGAGPAELQVIELGLDDDL